MVEALPEPEAAATSIEHRLVSVIIPLLLAERGDLVIHASAADTDAGAVLFAGPSGRGKSTTVAALARAGLPTLAEDGLVVEVAGGEPLAWAGRPRHPVEGPRRGGRAPPARTTRPGWPRRPTRPADGTAGGGGAGAGAAGRRAHPRPGSPRARRAAALGSSLFHRGGPEGLRPAFSSLARFVEAVPAYLCSLPDDLGALSEAAPEVIERVTRG